MKRFASSFDFATLLGVAAFALAAPSASATDAGEYDFGEFAVPEGGGEFVGVNLTRDLIAIVARLVGKEEPEVAAVLTGLHGVRVHVIGVDDSNRTELAKRATDARDALAKAGWQRVVSVREASDDVDVYVKTHGEDQIDGIVVTVLGRNDEAVFINVVGNIKPEQLVTVGERFGIEPLKELRKHTNHEG